MGKRGRADVQEFGHRLMDNLLDLQSDLQNGAYHHAGYYHFTITDPKTRQVHKASVRDRVLNHAVYRKLYPFFDRTFVHDSYSCRKNKGTHAALKRFNIMARRVSHNNTRVCWVLKCDIQQFFASIDHNLMLEILSGYIPDQGFMVLLNQIVESFEVTAGKGLPLGNLTSQLLVNVYMNIFDQYVKHRLKVYHYIRYADDFVLISHDRSWLLAQIPLMQDFLQVTLKLTMHPKKLELRTYTSGVDFLGWVNYPYHRILRTSTKKRMLQRIVRSSSESTLQSYLGLMSHGDTYELRQKLLNSWWLY